MVMYSAILADLLQNSAALSVATFNNIRNHNVDLKLGIIILLPAIIMVPIGVYTNISIPKILDFIVFASFLLFALYRLFSMNRKISEIKGKKGNLLAIAFGIIAGYIGGLIGIDGSPFAIIAISYILLDTKKISGTTGLVAFSVSLTGLFSYLFFLHIDSIPLWPFLVITGALGGLTGSYLMRKIKPLYVKYTIIALIFLALAEVLLHIISLV